MACYHPWVKDFPEGPRRLPCGQCIGCRLEHSRQWAIRIMDEASLHERNSFLTLTYADEHLPADGSLDKRAFPEFVARLRRRIAPRKVRYYHCGEYGEETKRPHYHAVLFGEDFRESRVEVKSKGDYPTWISGDLVELWPYGQSMIGSVTFESAAYVARYVVKKVTGSRAKEHYERVDPETGELVQVLAEFATMSNRPGIGAGWIDRFQSDVYPSDERVVNGKRMGPPRYYDERVEKNFPDMVADVKSRRLARSRSNMADRSAARLHVRELYTDIQANLRRRVIE